MKNKSFLAAFKIWLRCLIISCLILGTNINIKNIYASPTSVPVTGPGTFSWMQVDMSEINTKIRQCIEVPHFADTTTKSHTLDISNSGNWVSTGVQVKKDKFLEISWNFNGLSRKTEKYKVLYRIDPRFPKPQIFIKKYDHTQRKYLSDFYSFNGGKFVDVNNGYQDTPDNNYPNRFDEYDSYFKFLSSYTTTTNTTYSGCWPFIGCFSFTIPSTTVNNLGNPREKISLKKDDVVDISISETGSFFAEEDMTADLTPSSSYSGTQKLVVMDTTSPIDNNRIVYVDADNFCSDVRGDSSAYCTSSSGSTTYKDIGDEVWDTLRGANANILGNYNNMQPCQDSDSGRNHSTCYYDKGRGINISFAGNNIKNTNDKFIDHNGKKIFYYKADVDGELEIDTDWDIEGMYNGFSSISQLMSTWNTYNSYTDFNSAMVAFKPNLNMNFLHFGRYLLDVEVGSSLPIDYQTIHHDIRVEYLISSSSTPPSSATSGTKIEEHFRGNASQDGYLWLRVVDAHRHFEGSITALTVNYSGSTVFSDIVYGKLIKPLKDKFQELSRTIYTKLITDTSLQNIARAMLIIYVIIYGLTFLAGATQIKVLDLITRIIKIAIIVELFSETSWNFFNENLFDIFVGGTEELIRQIVGISSQDDNIFGFIDPVISKYINPDIWLLLFIQLLQIHLGLTFFAIMTMYAMLIFLRSILEVIVAYCMAFLAMAILISLAPFFIILVLFERTKDMFNNWISTLFSYMISPTVLLIFFLLADQVLGTLLVETITKACWGILIPIKIHIGIPGTSINFGFTIPFFPGISGYIPQIVPAQTIGDFYSSDSSVAAKHYTAIVTGSLIFFAWAKLSAGLVNYVSVIVQALTNVAPPRHDGLRASSHGPEGAVVSDIEKLASPVIDSAKWAARSSGSFIKNKVLGDKVDRSKLQEERNRIRQEREGSVDYDSLGNDFRNSSSSSSGGGSADGSGADSGDGSARQSSIAKNSGDNNMNVPAGKGADDSKDGKKLDGSNNRKNNNNLDAAKKAKQGADNKDGKENIDQNIDGSDGKKENNRDAKELNDQSDRDSGGSELRDDREVDDQSARDDDVSELRDNREVDDQSDRDSGGSELRDDREVDDQSAREDDVSELRDDKEVDDQSARENDDSELRDNREVDDQSGMGDDADDSRDARDDGKQPDKDDGKAGEDEVKKKSSKKQEIERKNINKNNDNNNGGDR